MWSRLDDFRLIAADVVHVGLGDGLWVRGGSVWIDAPADPGIEAQIIVECWSIKVRSKRVVDLGVITLYFDDGLNDRLGPLANGEMVKQAVLGIIKGVI